MNPTLKSVPVQYLVAFILGVLIAATLARGETPASPPSDPLLARGRYLVERVGMCADCHSPRNAKGEFVRERALGGSPLGFTPTMPMPWAPVAPAIAGLPTMSTPEALLFFQTGQRPNGTSALPPMPPFRFDAEDARAVVAYLKSLRS